MAMQIAEMAERRASFQGGIIRVPEQTRQTHRLKPRLPEPLGTLVYHPGMPWVSRTQEAFEQEFAGKFPLHVTRAIKRDKPPNRREMDVIEEVARINWQARYLDMGLPRDRGFAAEAVALGAIALELFGNFKAWIGHPHAAVVRLSNQIKGRPLDQTASFSTTRDRMHLPFTTDRMYQPFDWKRLPKDLSRKTVERWMDYFFSEGPFGFLGPARESMPDHLVQSDTTQIIAAGFACPSNALVEGILEIGRVNYVMITSVNVSSRTTGQEEPPHYRGREMRRRFGNIPGIIMVDSPGEEEIRSGYPPFLLPTSVSILAFNRLAKVNGRKAVVLERHGSSPIEHIREVVGQDGYEVVLGPKAQNRLLVRPYDD